MMAIKYAVRETEPPLCPVYTSLPLSDYLRSSFRPCERADVVTAAWTYSTPTVLVAVCEGRKGEDLRSLRRKD